MPTSQSKTSIENSEVAPHEFSTGARVAVLLPLPVSTAYDYVVPEGIVLLPGDIVEVPIGRRFEIGVVWSAGLGDVAENKLKDIVRKIDCPSLPDVLMRFIDLGCRIHLAAGRRSTAHGHQSYSQRLCAKTCDRYRLIGPVSSSLRCEGDSRTKKGNRGRRQRFILDCDIARKKSWSEAQGSFEV